MEFSGSDKMVSLLLSNRNIIPVFHRFGFKLGVGNKTIEQLCKEYEINPDFFITIVNTFNSKNYFPEKKLLSFSPLLIIDYLKNTHQYYIEYSLPKIEALLNKLISSYNTENIEIKTIQEFYSRYEKKLLDHIHYEENKVFPYIKNLINNPESEENTRINLDFEEEHTNVDFEIDDLKNLIIKYIPSNYNVLLCNELLTEIYRFEKDILDHSRIEDAVLIPQVQKIQQQL